MSKETNAKAYALVTLGNYKVANPQMKKEMDNILSSIQALEKNTWKYAISIYNVVVNKLYEDDFNDLDTFAKLLGYSNNSALSKMANAVQFALDNPTTNGVDTMSVLTTSKCYVLSSIKHLDICKDYVKNKLSMTYDKLVTTATKNELEEIVKDYKVTNSMKKKKVVDKEEEKTQYVQIVYNNEKYNIPVKILKKYKVEEGK